MFPILYYKLDEGVTDFSGNSNDGTNNGVTFASGKVNDSGIFDGASDIIIPALSSYSELNVAFWFKLDTLDGTNQVTIFDNLKDIDNRFTIYKNGSSSLQVDVEIGGVTKNIELTTSLVTDTWYHVNVSYDGSNLKGYLDKTLIDTVAHSGSIDFTSTGKLGNDNDAENTNMTGSMDEIRIYSSKIIFSELEKIYYHDGVHEMVLNGKDVSVIMEEFYGSREFAKAQDFNALILDRDKEIIDNIPFRSDCYIKNNGTKIFRGFLDDEPTISRAKKVELLFTGYEQRFMERFISISFVDKTISEMIIQIIDTYYSSEFTYNNVNATNDTYTLDFLGRSVWDIFQTIVSFEDRQIWLDNDKDLHLNEIFGLDSLISLDIDAGDRVKDPKFPQYGSSIFNSAIINSKMRDIDGEGGDAVRFNDVESISKFGTIIEHPPVQDNSADDDIDCVRLGRELVDPNSDFLQDGELGITYNPTIYGGQFMRLTYSDRNFSSKKFLILKAQHSNRPRNTFLKLAEIESSSIKLLRNLIKSYRKAEERNIDSSSDVASIYYHQEEIQIDFTFTVETQNVGGRQWNEAPWNQTSWEAGAGSWTEQIGETEMVFTDAGRVKTRDILLGNDSEFMNGDNLFIGLGSDPTEASPLDTELGSEDDINSDPGETRAPMDAGYPIEPTPYKIRARGSVGDADEETGTHYEMALFSASSLGTMYSRKEVGAGIFKNANENLRITIDIEVVDNS